MKAEHRKELETNTLADKMGNVVQRVKTGRRSTFMLYVAVGAIAAGGLWFWWVTYVGGKQEASERWLRLDDGGLKNLSELAEKHGDTPAGKAARLQLAWLAYWELGVRRMGAEPGDAMMKLKIASSTYERLVKDCADDPLFEPQALLGFAVVEETKAVQDTAMLDSAVKAYQKVVDKYKDSAEGAYAQERLKQLQDKDSRKEITGIYEELRRGLNIQNAQVQGLIEQFEAEKKKAAPKP